MRRRDLLHKLLVPAGVFLLAGLAALLPAPWPVAAAAAAAVLAGWSAATLLGSVADAEHEKCFLDEQLIQSQKLASIGELSSGIAHEINNPMAIIGQEAELITLLLADEKLAGAPGITEVNDSVREIARQVDRCRDITHKLLSFARKMKPVVQDTDVNRLVEDMVALIDKEAAMKNIRIIRGYAPELPHIMTDPPLLRQVVLNLLTNAAYAVGQAGGGGEITVTTRETARLVEIEVRDTGPGIPPEALPKIFDPFFTTKPQGQGTGLGLSICHGIVTRLGGRIEAASGPGGGAQFTVSLPKQA